ncbi:FGGY-family carbohydrate kinase [Streptomyces canus]|uniref:FGGY-family carbohydrate kinase n=1 Tax=Streptomyces canus TaxID=58343 RepID=UPI002783CE0D|nr:FGGY family carbohydrate kinase [Streptomyces canus]MDQ0765521.1 sugar (pentulose or hexulose) kinase [Streptomyces canus]
MTAVTIGVDIATADVRAVAVTGEGRVLAVASAPLPPPTHPRTGWSEQDAVYAAVSFDVLAELTAQLGPRPVAGVCVTSTSGTVVPCDEHGNRAGPAVMYDDQRTRTGPEAAPALPDALARVAWLQRYTPAPRYLHVADTVTAALAGRLLPTDTSHALKTGADPVTLTWPQALLDSAEVSSSQLPPLERPGRIVGTVDKRAAERTGLPSGTPLVLGMTDGCTGQIAAGAVRPGQGVGVLGTTLVIKAVSRRQIMDPYGAFYSHRAPDGLWWPGGASNVGAGALQTRYPARDLPALDEAAWLHGPARHLRYPLTRTGERFPFRVPDATGFTLGTSEGETDIFRSFLEGTAFTERLGLEVLAAAGAAISGPLRAVGGGSRSTAWLRIRATVLDRPLEVPAEPSSGFGAAVLAAAGTLYDDIGEAVGHMVRTAVTAEPDPAQLSVLQEGYRQFTGELQRRGWLASPLPSIVRPRRR